MKPEPELSNSENEEFTPSKKLMEEKTSWSHCSAVEIKQVKHYALRLQYRQ